MIAILLLVACGASPAPHELVPAADSAEAIALDAVVEAWRARGDLPELDAAEVRRIVIVDADDAAEYRRFCPAQSGECAPVRNRCEGPAGMFCRDFDRLVVIAPGSSPERRLALIRHGAIHHAAAAADVADPTHHDRRLWPYVCRREQDEPCARESVEERAAGRGPL